MAPWPPNGKLLGPGDRGRARGPASESPVPGQIGDRGPEPGPGVRARAGCTCPQGADPPIRVGGASQSPANRGRPRRGTGGGVSPISLTEQIGDGDGGASPPPGKSGTEVPVPVPRRTNPTGTGTGTGTGSGCPRPACPFSGALSGLLVWRHGSHSCGIVRLSRAVLSRWYRDIRVDLFESSFESTEIQARPSRCL
jgi:hypothetical protein